MSSRAKIVISGMFLVWAVLGSAQVVTVGRPDPDFCKKVETIKPNLVLADVTNVFGRVTDQTGAPFIKKQVELRIFVTDQKQISEKIVKTDANGKFDLGQVKKGSYRLLLSESRAFRQADELDCAHKRECELNVTLKVNPTDMPESVCPVK